MGDDVCRFGRHPDKQKGILSVSQSFGIGHSVILIVSVSKSFGSGHLIALFLPQRSDIC